MEFLSRFWHHPKNKSLSDKVLSLFKQTPLVQKEQLKRLSGVIKSSAENVEEHLQNSQSQKSITSRGDRAVLVFNIIVCSLYGDGKFKLDPDRILDLQASLFSRKVAKPIKSVDSAMEIANTDKKLNKNLSNNQKFLAKLLKEDQLASQERTEMLNSPEFRMGV